MTRPNEQRPTPGDPGYLAWRRQQAEIRRAHVALQQAIEERGLSPREICYRRLMKQVWILARLGNRLPQDLDARQPLRNLSALAAALDTTQPRTPTVW